MSEVRRRAPAGLRARGRRFWKDTLDEFELSESEVQILVEVCRTLDNLDALNDVVGEQGATTEGSQGQTVVHPALQEVRQQRANLHRLIAALGLPDDDGGSVRSALSLRSISGNSSRWAGHVSEAQRKRGGRVG